MPGMSEVKFGTSAVPFNINLNVNLPSLRNRQCVACSWQHFYLPNISVEVCGRLMDEFLLLNYTQPCMQ